VVGHARYDDRIAAVSNSNPVRQDITSGGGFSENPSSSQHGFNVFVSEIGNEAADQSDSGN